MFHRWSNSQHDQERNDLYSKSKIKELKDAIGPLSGRSLKYCTDDCLRRYLEARNWNVDMSKKRIHLSGDQHISLRIFSGMRLPWKVRQANCLEQVFMTDKEG